MSDDCDDDKVSSSCPFAFDKSVTFEEIRLKQSEFAEERNWSKYHTPRNLLLALTGEVGELAELFQWKSDNACDVHQWEEKERERVGEEVSDILLYAIRLAEVCKIDLPSAILRKLQLNAEKYPAGRVYGSSKKYTEYEENRDEKFYSKT